MYVYIHTCILHIDENTIEKNIDENTIGKNIDEITRIHIDENTIENTHFINVKNTSIFFRMFSNILHIDEVVCSVMK